MNSFSILLFIFVLTGCSKPEIKIKTLVKEAHLPSGRQAHVELDVLPRSNGLYAQIKALRMTVEDQPVYVPDHVLDGLTNGVIDGGIQLAEFGRETYLLLRGGSEGSAWEAKLTAADSRITQRTLGTPGELSVETRYAPPPGEISPPVSTWSPTPKAIHLIEPFTLTNGVHHD